MATLPPDFEQHLNTFLHLAGKKAYANTSFSDFTQWVREAVPAVFPASISQIPDDPQEVKAFLGMAASNLYADFPLPARDLQAPGKAKLGRNDPCDCRSGQKYKHCCGNVSMPPWFGQLHLLRYVLDAYPKTELTGVAASEAQVDAVADTAYQWLQEHQAARAAALLEPFFAGEGPLTARLAPLFNLWMDLWLNLGKRAKRENLIDSILLRGDRVLRSDALQRRTTMLADKVLHGLLSCRGRIPCYAWAKSESIGCANRIGRRAGVSMAIGSWRKSSWTRIAVYAFRNKNLDGVAGNHAGPPRSQSSLDLCIGNGLSSGLHSTVTTAGLIAPARRSRRKSC